MNTSSIARELRGLIYEGDLKVGSYAYMRDAKYVEHESALDERIQRMHGNIAILNVRARRLMVEAGMAESLKDLRALCNGASQRLVERQRETERYIPRIWCGMDEGRVALYVGDMVDYSRILFDSTQEAADGLQNLVGYYMER